MFLEVSIGSFFRGGMEQTEMRRSWCENMRGSLKIKVRVTGTTPREVVVGKMTDGDSVQVEPVGHCSKNLSSEFILAAGVKVTPEKHGHVTIPLHILHDMVLEVHEGGKPVTILPCGGQVHGGVERRKNIRWGE
jgi:hypothetical protein